MADSAENKKSNLAPTILDWFDQLEGGASNWRNTWDDIARYVQPRKSRITSSKAEGSQDDINLYNTAALEGCQILAAGLMDYLFSGRWFDIAPPFMAERDQEAKLWCANASQVMMREISSSNFEVELHEMILDYAGFGTGAMIAESATDDNMRSGFNRGSILRFNNVRIGKFVCAEGVDNVVDTFIWKFNLTASQAVQRYGKENVGEKILAKYESDNPAEKNCKFEFIHAIYPRIERDVRAWDAVNKPIASVTVCRDSKSVVRNSGYDEYPVSVCRYMKWEDDPYGYCPSMTALPTIRQVNFMERCMDALAEKKAFPPVLVPENLDGNDIDYRSGGQTIFDPNQPNAVPREWMNNGQYDVGKDRIEDKNAMINRLYHVDFFQMFRNLNREMTAYEVSRRLAEKVSNISPSFKRFVTEFFNVILFRVFMIMFREGRFGTPPQSMLIRSGDGSLEMETPSFQITGKLAQAIRAEENSAFQMWVNAVAPLAQIAGPSVFDAVDLNKASRNGAINFGVSSEVMRTPAEEEELRAARAQAEQAQQQAALAVPMTKAAEQAANAQSKARSW